MSRVVELLCSRRVPHVAALALMSIGFAGCSADMQTRLSQENFSNPFASQPEATGSVRTPAVERRELPQYSRPQAQYQSQPLPPPIAAPAATRPGPTSSAQLRGVRCGASGRSAASQDGIACEPGCGGINGRAELDALVESPIPHRLIVVQRVID